MIYKKNSSYVTHSQKFRDKEAFLNNTAQKQYFIFVISHLTNRELVK